ncbi:catalase [Deinococcus sp. 23YEL01]|uniref:catalase n=1 Tax=Deinococcus sp. 23YEL01 TaxID=2745871 RepID=UPI001E636239|nr:catalase [Deinococcus sp. 23YEL01]MCD0170066.1 catalase [Deinococcus sp. 23YEL01]
MPEKKATAYAPTESADMTTTAPQAPQGRLTNHSGNLAPSNTNSLTAGERGPVLLQDWHLLERMAHFNRERVPERVVHAKGSGAFGTFRVTRAIPELTVARIFQKEGNECRMLARFSTVAGEKGFADTVRDPRGFALKFYTEDGNWDLVGNNTPIFFVRDPIKFQDFIHSQKRHPVTGRRSAAMQFDFWGLRPESLHQVMYLFGDRGLPRSYRFMNGYSSHTYSLWNEQGERFYVKWHFHSQQGVQNLTEEVAAKIAAANPDYHFQDLFDAIERGENPKWTVSIQVMPEKDAETYHINPFDLTKVWPHADYPLMQVGEFELNENPQNYFAEIEQAAFEPSNLPRGFGASPDKMLQARLMSYADAHRYRIGINYAALPVNQAACPVMTYHRDGQTRFDSNFGGTPVYEPNSYGGPAVAEGTPQEPPMPLGSLADRFGWPEDDADLYGQPRELYRVMQPDERQRLAMNFAGALADVPAFIADRFIGHLEKVSGELAGNVRSGIAQKKAEGHPELTDLLTETHTHAAGGDQKPSQSVAVGADD